jgi:hypothetical protein
MTGEWGHSKSELTIHQLRISEREGLFAVVIACMYFSSLPYLNPDDLPNL